jgi:hypothetical protein
MAISSSQPVQAHLELLAIACFIAEGYGIVVGKVIWEGVPCAGVSVWLSVGSCSWHLRGAQADRELAASSQGPCGRRCASATPSLCVGFRELEGESATLHMLPRAERRWPWRVRLRPHTSLNSTPFPSTPPGLSASSVVGCRVIVRVSF